MLVRVEDMRRHVEEGVGTTRSGLASITMTVAPRTGWQRPIFLIMADPSEPPTRVSRRSLWIDMRSSMFSAVIGVSMSEHLRTGAIREYEILVRHACLIPGFDGALFSREWKEALWVRFTTAAPRRLRRSVERYSIVKRA